MVNNSYSPLAKFLIEKWQTFHQTKFRDQEDTFEVSQVFGFIARVYEKIRATVENKSEQVVRRFAIERALKRGDTQTMTVEKQAELTIRELTWSRFLPNNYITREQFANLIQTINKYRLLERYLIQIHSDSPKEWLLDLMSAEIEEMLMPSFTRDTIVPAFCEWVRSKYIWNITPPTNDDERDTQIYVAAHRAIAKSDAPVIHYYLMTLMFPTWSNLTEVEISEIALKFPQIYIHINSITSHSLKNRWFRWVRQNTAPFIIIDSYFDSSPRAEVFKNIEELQIQISQLAREKYAYMRSQIRKGIVQSIIYIFVTKVLVALLIEVPYDRYIEKDINYVSVAINLLFPPAFMFLIGLTVKGPSEENTRILTEKVMEIFTKDFKNSPPSIVHLRMNSSGQRWNIIFYAIYIYFAVLIALGIAYFLKTVFNFNVVALGLFFMFLSLVMLFGFRLRWQSQELIVSRQNQGFFENLITILSLPFINLGFYLSSTISKINLITFILDKIIDAPLKKSVNSAEEWSKFIREKREEVVEVPRD